MAVSMELVDDIAKVVASGPVDEASIAALRQQFEGVHFTYCMDDDIVNAKPVREHAGFNIYLVDGREHCLCLTNDFDNATGVAVAELYDDEE